MSDAGKAAQSAREVVERHLEALEEYNGPMVEDVVASDGAPLNALVRTTKALRALLAKPPSDTLARLVEAAEAAVRAVMDDAVTRGWGTVEKADAMAQRSDLYKEAIAPFRAAVALREAISAHRASVDALGFRYPETIARVNAALEAERAKTEAMKRERDEAREEWSFWKRAFEEATSLRKTANDQLRIAEKERDEARKKLDDLRFERDEARKERDALFATRDRRMLKDRYEQAAKERDALKAEVERLRADPIRMASAIPEPSGGEGADAAPRHPRRRLARGR